MPDRLYLAIGREFASGTPAAARLAACYQHVFDQRCIHSFYLKRLTMTRRILIAACLLPKPCAWRMQFASDAAVLRQAVRLSPIEFARQA